jgi:hypothetical protein
VDRNIRSAPSQEQARLELVERLRLLRVEWEEAVLTYAVNSSPDQLGQSDVQFVFGDREVASACLDCALLAIEYGEDWSGPIPPTVILQERRAIQNGVSVLDRLDRYLAAYQRAWLFVLEETRFSDIPSNGKMALLREASMASSTLLWRLLREVLDVHLSELFRAAQTRTQRTADLVREILAGNPVDLNELDYELDVDHVALIAIGPDAKKGLELVANRLGRRLLAVPQADGTLWAWLSGLRTTTTADIHRCFVESVDPSAAAIISRSSHGVAGFRATHRLAKAALLVARGRPDRITLYEDVELAALAMQDDALANSLVETYIAPLDRDHQGAQLRQTLKALFQAGLNEEKAGKLLDRHRHTVERRIVKIRKLIGRPLHECYAAIETALMVAESRRRHPDSPWP